MEESRVRCHRRQTRNITPSHPEYPQAAVQPPPHPTTRGARMTTVRLEARLKFVNIRTETAPGHWPSGKIVITLDIEPPRVLGVYSVASMSECLSFDAAAPQDFFCSDRGGQTPAGHGTALPRPASRAPARRAHAACRRSGNTAGLRIDANVATSGPRPRPRCCPRTTWRRSGRSPARSNVCHLLADLVRRADQRDVKFCHTRTPAAPGTPRSRRHSAVVNPLRRKHKLIGGRGRCRRWQPLRAAASRSSR